MKKEDMKADDVLVKNPIGEKKLKEEEAKMADEVEVEESVPSGYIPVKLSSMGKLNLPAIVHVRDYTYEEALTMAEMIEDKISEAIINVLNNVVYEDVDMGKAHVQDIMEILLTIFANWYSDDGHLEVFKYYVDLEKTGDEKEDKSNISVAHIPIPNIQTIPLAEEVKIPVTISKGNLTVAFVPPKMENEVKAWRFAVKKHLAWENKISNAIHAVKKNEASDEQLAEYEEFTNERSKTFMRTLQAQLIYAINGKELPSLKEKLEALSEIPLGFWSTYNFIMKEKFNFGVQEEVEFTCSITHEPITRRFQFRPLHFLPVLESKSSTGFNISFG